MRGRPQPGPDLARSLAGWIPTLAVIIGLHRLQSAWAAMAIYHGLALAYLALNRQGPSPRLLVSGWRPGLGWGLSVLGLLSGGALLHLWPQAALAGHSLAYRLAELQVPPDRWWLFCAYYLVVTPPLEELFWRGHLAGPSRRPDRSDLMFALYHVLVLVKFIKPPYAGLSFVILIGVGWTWRRVRTSTGGLSIPVLSHLAADVSVVLAVAWLIR